MNEPQPGFSQRAGPGLSRYETPTSVEAALALLARHGPRARLLTGGTDLLRELARDPHPRTDVLIDVSRIPGLDEIRELPDGGFAIGSGVTHGQVVRAAPLVARALALAQACLETGSPQIRNRGTLAGNVVTGDPAGDALCALLALGASAKLRSARGERSLAVAEVRDAIAPDEMLIEIGLPPAPLARRGIFSKLAARRGQAVSIVNGAVVLDFDADGGVSRATIALGNAGSAIRRADEAEGSVLGSPLSDAVIERAAQAARRECAPPGDVFASADYRREMIALLVARALRALRDGAERSQWPERPVSLWGHARDGRSPRGERFAASHAPGSEIEARVNGRSVRAPCTPGQNLLAWLRESTGLTGCKDGCGEGVCGACTVRLDGLAVLTCLVPAARAQGAELLSVEGLAGEDGLHPVQRAFVECGAVQCGFCTPGFAVTGAALLEEAPSPSREQIESAFAGNLCRCTGYHAILRALERAGDGNRNA